MTTWQSSGGPRLIDHPVREYWRNLYRPYWEPLQWTECRRETAQPETFRPLFSEMTKEIVFFYYCCPPLLFKVQSLISLDYRGEANCIGLSQSDLVSTCIASKKWDWLKHDIGLASQKWWKGKRGLQKAMNSRQFLPNVSGKTCGVWLYKAINSKSALKHNSCMVQVSLILS